ncbi:hypothetical protein NLJ89_g7846 [Agrocybe chaxingu]|uniref:Uncharacterized protein n=1 Tax=Agrocybe chaxingu TaxID=84603 RepID=A0A9W8JWD3_9AGAR|nr:hypothetical protein NLJ89_g7846 [Agrocybe chaxingu]
MFSYPRPNQLALLVFFHYLLLFSTQVNALPLRARQATDGPRSVTTVSTTNTPMGPVTQTCVIVFTPIKDAQGNDAVVEVKTCTITMGGSPSGSVSTAAPTATDTASSSSSTSVSTTSAATTAATTSSSASSSTLSTQPPASTVSTTSASSSVETSSAPATTVSTSASASATASGGPIVVIGVSTVSVPATSTAAVSTNTAATSVSTSAAASATNGNGGIVVVGVSTVSAPAQTATPAGTPTDATAGTPTATDTTSVEPSAVAASGSAAAVESPTEEAAFTLPGKQLSVLPIGLGVFAGISVIALIVVGLVTYERTKYRKAFRQRKLAESGAAMGYGGNMA